MVVVVDRVVMVVVVLSVLVLSVVVVVFVVSVVIAVVIVIPGRMGGGEEGKKDCLLPLRSSNNTQKLNTHTHTLVFCFVFELSSGILFEISFEMHRKNLVES